MFHSIITILTTAGVALHALLGCCAHHAHSAELDGTALAEVVPVNTENHCSHSHHHGDDDSSNEPSDHHSDDHSDHQHHGSHKSCGEGDCSFTSAQRNNDLELIQIYSFCCQLVGDVATAIEQCQSLALNAPTGSPPDLLFSSGSARAATQVWQL